MAVLEIACFSVEGALLAGEAGVGRIELCENQDAGGTTPPSDWLSQVKARVEVPVFVMIRPRGGDFVYSRAEFEEMLRSIDEMRPMADGFVFGVLDPDRNVDVARTSCLVQRAHPLPCTFHRAFDETPDPMAAIEEVISAGCHAILSSGGAADAVGGVRVLKAMVDQAAGRIAVMPGGGVRMQHLGQLREATKAKMFHSSAMVKGAHLPDALEMRCMHELLQQDLAVSAASSTTIPRTHEI